MADARWLKRNPWWRFFDNARIRCTYASHKMFYKYGGAGVQFHLTLEGVKKAWERDRAWELERPSLDRFPDVHGHYTDDNIRFIELVENIALGNKNRVHKVGVPKPGAATRRAFACWATGAFLLSAMMRF